MRATSTSLLLFLVTKAISFQRLHYLRTRRRTSPLKNQSNNVNCNHLVNFGSDAVYELMDVSSSPENPQRNRSRRRDLFLLLNSLSSFPMWLQPSAANGRAIEESNKLEKFRCEDDDTIVRIPLEYVSRLQAYVIYYRIGDDNNKFGAILDTGSPFLTVPSYCDSTKWGCYRPSDSRPSGYPPTVERFDNNQGSVEWRKASLSLVVGGHDGGMVNTSNNRKKDKLVAQSPSSSAVAMNSEVVFGVLSESLMDGPGGVFFGLIKYTDSWIRPSFLSQTNVRSFQIALADPQYPTLTLSNRSILSDVSSSDFVPLVRDLQKFGDPTVHYTVRAQQVLVNGNPLIDRSISRNGSSNDNWPIYVILDSGVTGLVVSRELWDQRYRTARERKEKSLWGGVQVAMSTNEGRTLTLEATKPLTTPLGERPWPKFRRAHLMVVGLAFLQGRTTTIDADANKLWIS